MRIWDLSPGILCDKHLLGEHRELHAIWTFLTTDKGGAYRKHPETLRWHGKLPALYTRHELLTAEMINRGWTHKTPITKPEDGQKQQTNFLNTVAEQRKILKSKNCQCKI